MIYLEDISNREDYYFCLAKDDGVLWVTSLTADIRGVTGAIEFMDISSVV